jgi:tetraacyldisaccharide 4'-kinase
VTKSAPSQPPGFALDRLYAAAASARRRWYERHPEARHRLARPVISIGNLSVGGTGKTPLTMALAEWLLAEGERPSILSRGYKRADPVDGVVVVSDGARVLANLARSGDEPFMLARAVPGAIVCVAEDRHLAGVLAERRLDATVHLLDDGFQHVQLARDFNVPVTSAGEIAAGRPLPFGRLREAPDAAARADFVVIVDADPDSARTEAWELGISAFATARRKIAAPNASGAPGVAVAGIGDPARFFDMLRDAGYRVEATMAFADHHPFTAADVARIDATVREARAAVVLTTCKDAVRFESLGSLPFTVAPVAMRLEVDGWDALTASLVQAIRRVRGSA